MKLDLVLIYIGDACLVLLFLKNQMPAAEGQIKDKKRNKGNKGLMIEAENKFGKLCSKEGKRGRDKCKKMMKEDGKIIQEEERGTTLA